MATRKVAAIDGQGRIAVIEEPVADPKPGQVQIEVTASMVSPGTELGGVKRRREKPVGCRPSSIWIFQCRRGDSTRRGV